MTSLTDLFPALRRGYRRELVLLAICSTCCIMGLSLVTEVCIVKSMQTVSFSIIYATLKMLGRLVKSYIYQSRENCV